MWLNYHHLYYFKTIAEEQSVSKAADKLRLGQPTLSAQLKQFEDYLGVKLFDRYHKKLVLTEQGKLALEYSQNIFKLGSEMVDALQDRIQPEKLKIQIGALDSIPKSVLSDMAESCFQKSPLQMGFSEGNLDYLLRELDSHKIDLVVTDYLPAQKENKNVYYKQIYRDEIKIFGNEKFKNLKKKFPEELSNQKMILPSYQSRLRADLDHWFRINQVNVDVAAETQDMALKKQLAVSGFGLIATTKKSVELEIENGQLYELGVLKNVHQEIYLIAQDRKVSHPMTLFLMKEFSI